MVRWMFAFSLLCGSIGVEAETLGKLGLGVIVGEPTGVSMKSWIDAKTAVDFAAAWSLNDTDFSLHADYLVNDFTGIKVRRGRMGWYYGFGGRFESVDHAKDDDEDRVGMRLPLGLNYLMPAQPLEFFGELVPVFDVVPDTEFRLNVGVGLRYYVF